MEVIEVLIEMIRSDSVMKTMIILSVLWGVYGWWILLQYDNKNEDKLVPFLLFGLWLAWTFLPITLIKVFFPDKSFFLILAVMLVNIIIGMTIPALLQKIFRKNKRKNKRNEPHGMLSGMIFTFPKDNEIHDYGDNP